MGRPSLPAAYRRVARLSGRRRRPRLRCRLIGVLPGSPMLLRPVFLAGTGGYGGLHSAAFGYPVAGCGPARFAHLGDFCIIL